MSGLGKINTLRNQIFLGFMVVMIIVLAAVGFFTYAQVSVMLQQNAEKHLQQTAVQATGKLDVLLRQADTFTMQVASHATVQRLMLQAAEGKSVSFEERQSIQREVRKQEAYMTGIRSVELYTNEYRMLLSFTYISLDNRVPSAWIGQADEKMGNLVWFSMDPRFPDVIAAIRQVRIIDRSFAKAGYLLVLIDKNYFELTDTGTNVINGTREMMGLFDVENQTIHSDFSNEVNVERMLEQGVPTVMMDGEKFKAIGKRSDTTGWTMIILTPLDYAAEGLSVLRTIITVSILVGGLLFLFLTFLLSTLITNPILHLIKAMRNAKLGTLRPIVASSSAMEINELTNTYNQMADSLNELIGVVYHKELNQSRTELKALQAQINPHFLFNTLEAINWALVDKGEEELSQVVLAMSGLFRYVISPTDEDEWVTVGDELDHAERYLKIMDMRMLSRLSWNIEAREGSRGVPIPKLLVQPLVENAISHGVEQRVGAGLVKVRVEPSSRTGFTRIAVSDNGPGMDREKVLALYAAMDRGHDPSSSKGTGVGLSNVARRLKLYYEQAAGTGPGLDIQSEPGKGTTIAFEIPNEHGEGLT